VDIDLPRLLTRVRAGASSYQSSVTSDQSRGEALPSILKFGLQMYTRLTTNPKLFAASQTLAALGARLVSPRAEWMRFPALTGWGYSKDFPRPAAKSFRARWKDGKLGIGTLGTGTLGIDKKQSTNPPIYQPTNLPVTNLPEQFTTELTALGGTVIACAQENLGETLTHFLRSREATRVFVDTVGAESLPEGFDAVREPDPTIKVGLTGCAAGIANTGTVLVLDAGETLKASLLPETHLVILRASQLVADLPDALALTRGAPNAVLVTGPSRTADIEMTLTIGVHGPKEIIVFLVDDSKGG
jgi:L-lactate dehydrogenase complex protein LldG